MSSSSQARKNKLSDEFIYDSEDEENHKRLRIAAEEEEEDQEENIKSFTTDAGETYWLLGNKKRVTVREWKGKALIDIREFYGETEDDEEEGEASLKPGKKGISLNLDQWGRLKSLVESIDAKLLKKQPKKK